MHKNVVLFGATGSVGTSVIEVLSKSPKNFKLSAVTCNENISDLLIISEKFKCKNIGIANKNIDQKEYIKNVDDNYVYGIENFDEFINDEVDIYILAISGLESAELALKIAKTGKIFAIANKENIISLGKILINSCNENKTVIFPLDSEHNAIYQILNGNNYSFKDIILTASGGPFLNYPLNKFSSITPKEAIKHPKWKMGHKISIDSSNMMNKSLELIEAKNLFNLKNNEVHSIIHPQAIIHGIINYNDNSSLAFLSQPSMQIPISSLFFPDKDFRSNNYSLDLADIKKLEFYDIDIERFPAFKLCKFIMQEEGIAPHLFNYINDHLVYLFLEHKIKYTDIVNFNEKVIEYYFKDNQNIESPTITDINDTSIWIDQNLKSIIKI